MSDPIDNNHPVGGVDYPRTLQEFDEWFPTEDVCTAYLLESRSEGGGPIHLNESEVDTPHYGNL